MRFWLGTDAHWIGKIDVPIFVSHNRLCTRKRLRRAAAPVAIDSGAFTTISTHGHYTEPENAYIDAVARYQDEIGIEWAAPRDWMCEPFILAKTGLTVREHQARTVESFLSLRESGLPFIPVLQGWTPDEYLRCVDLYREADVDLRDEPLVGIGGVCRRQATSEIRSLVGTLHDAGIRLHGFGVKTSALRSYGWALASADSFAWAFTARKRNLRLPGCTHRNCTNCKRWALTWRRSVLDSLATDQQLSLFAAQGETRQ